MKPDPRTVLDAIAKSLVRTIMPAVADPYARDEVAKHALLLGALAEEFDRAAARRIEENVALRALFAAFAKVIVAEPLASRLKAAASGRDGSHLVSDLDRANQELRRLLIEAHTALESLMGDAARRLEAEVWRELRQSTERRRLSVGRF